MREGGVAGLHAQLLDAKEDVGRGGAEADHGEGRHAAYEGEGQRQEPERHAAHDVPREGGRDGRGEEPLAAAHDLVELEQVALELVLQVLIEVALRAEAGQRDTGWSSKHAKGV